MDIYLVKRQIFDEVTDSWEHDEVIAVCSSLEQARLYVDKPNFDIIVTRWTVDGDADTEVLIKNIYANDK